jgi:hypothetical protein
MANKKITIERLAASSQEQFLALERKMASGFKEVREDMNVMRDTMKEGFHIVLEEIRGLRDDVKIARQAARVDHAGVIEQLEKLETDMKKVKEKVQIEQ